MSTTQEDTLLSTGSTYAHRRKELLALVKKLRASGAQADLDLPRIAVIGNQSAGKSSLVEAISGITVPRDAGTCTRCPMECRLSSSSGPWRCQVSIRWEFDATSKRRDDVHEVAFGNVITDKAHVEPMLRRAQLAVLNPAAPTSTFLTKDRDELADWAKQQSHRSLPFSRNVVCIDLAGPDLTDLSFVDLPGIIQNAEPEIVRLVEDLVMSHIQGNCLILVTLPMSDDIDNQKAARLARDVDPQGLRTIGVMTKPDTLPAGSTKLRELWLALLEGRSDDNRLTHGYFCTRQPDDAERTAGITSLQARAAETEFFAKTSPWSRSTQQHRFGTQNLVKTLSQHLIQVINDSLPKLQNEVVQQLVQCRSELDRLPPPISSDPTSYILNLITSFCQDIAQYVQGGTSSAELVQANRAHYARFKRDIRGTAPSFLPYPSEQQRPREYLQYLEFDDEMDDDGCAENNFFAGGASKYMYLTDVRRFIQQSITRELPNNVPYPAKVALIIAFQKTWKERSQECFDRVYTEFNKVLSTQVARKFYRYAQLEARINLAVQGLLKHRKEATLTYLTTMLKLERMPFTQNGHYLAEKMAKTLARYKDARAGKAAPERPTSSVQTASATAFNFSAAPIPTKEASGQTKTATKSTKSLPQFTVSGFGASATTQPSGGLFGQSSQASTPAQSSVSSSASSSTVPDFFGKPATQTASPFSGSKAASPTETSVPLSFNQKNTFAANGSALTVNPNAFASATAAHSSAQNQEERQKDVDAALAALAKLGYSGLTIDDLGKLNPPDEFEEELQVMAEVRGYFQVAYKRVIDYIPLSIDNLFLYGLMEVLQASLIEKLGLGTDKAAERCTAFLSEDPSIVAMRKELLAKKERLENVQYELENFGLSMSG